MPSTSKCTCNFIPQRWVFAILSGTGLGLQTLFSVMMSITIIEMVVRTESFDVEENHSCRSADTISSTNKTFSILQKEDDVSIKRYPWSEYTQGIILSSFAWSSVVSTFFCGTLAERYGGKHILGFAILFQAILTCITPFLVNWGGSTALIITRASIGLATDGMFSVVSTMIPRWSTPVDRTTFGNAIFSGTVLAIFFADIGPALIITYSGMGWPAVFYFFGIVGMIWFLLWITFVYENPDAHPFITDEEIQYLQRRSESNKQVSRKLPPPPWEHIFRCKEFWAFTIICMGYNSVNSVTLSGLPRYLGNVVKFPIENNGYFLSLPYIFMWLSSLLSAWISDKVLEKQWISLTNARKILAVMTTTGPGMFLLLASYAECNKTIVVVMFMIGITLSGNYGILMLSPMDLSPNYAGSITSAAFGIASFVAILVPYLIGVLVPNSTLGQWRIVFWIVFSFACCSSAVYLFWFKAEVQSWNEPEFIRNKSRSTKEREEVELKLMY